MDNSIPKSCSRCIYSSLTLHNYLRCKLTGNCYIPSVMEDKISEVCPLKLNIRKVVVSVEK